jgi:hypothetical protein
MMRAMVARTIPILPAAVLGLEPPPPVLLSGPPERVGRVLDALNVALGPCCRTWLRELLLSDGEAWVAFAPGLGLSGLVSAERAFEALRRVLPDTDIYIRAASH